MISHSSRPLYYIWYSLYLNFQSQKKKEPLGEVDFFRQSFIMLSKKNCSFSNSPISLFQVLNQFMTQIEQLEKTIDINEIAKNGNVKKLVRDGERKDARIQDLEEALKRQKSETESTKVELIDDVYFLTCTVKGKEKTECCKNMLIF